MPRRVLLADDQPDNRIIFSTMLQYGGFDVVAAANGAEAVEQARRTRPELILMDLMMPVMDGWAAIAELQRDALCASIPVIAISAHDREHVIEREARLAGCAGYLAKPLDPRTLLEAVHRWFAEAPATGWIDFAQPASGADAARLRPDAS
jgi:CheY-like chemotaxis protein